MDDVTGTTGGDAAPPAGWDMLHIAHCQCSIRLRAFSIIGSNAAKNSAASA